MTTRVKCPGARQARSGDCMALGCDHISGGTTRVCPCCLRRLGQAAVDLYRLRQRYGSHDEFRALEDEMLGKLNAIPRAEPVKRYGPKGVVVPRVAWR